MPYKAASPLHADVDPPPLAVFDAVGKTFANGTAALQSCGLDLREGEILALLGPSGCGKSTALRLLAGLDEPSSGRITWPRGKPETSFVFQEPTLMPWADAFANVWLPLRLRGLSRKAAREPITEALSLVGLTDFASAYPNELSGGMKMRVSIARSLVVRPRLLLMDEPFAALDEITRFKLNNDLLRLQTALAMTVVFVTHSIAESVYLASRVGVMTARPGRLFASIPVDASLLRDESFRFTPRYTDTCREVSDALRHASEVGQPAPAGV